MTFVYMTRVVRLFIRSAGQLRERGQRDTLVEEQKCGRNASGERGNTTQGPHQMDSVDLTAKPNDGPDRM